MEETPDNRFALGTPVAQPLGGLGRSKQRLLGCALLHLATMLRRGEANQVPSENGGTPFQIFELTRLNTQIAVYPTRKKAVAFWG